MVLQVEKDGCMIESFVIGTNVKYPSDHEIRVLNLIVDEKIRIHEI